MKRCLQLCLKLVNATIGLVGIAMILYSIWMIRVWQRDAAESSSSSDHYNDALPWFIHAFLGIGIALCAITCLGHFAANTANHYCLSCYSVVIFLLILLDTAIIADVFLNSDWEKDLPEDPSGRFDDFKDFVESHIEICKWIALFVVLAQGSSVLLATVLTTLGTEEENSNHDSDSDSDEENNQPRDAFLSQTGGQIFPPYVLGAPLAVYNNDPFWKVTTH